MTTCVCFPCMAGRSRELMPALEVVTQTNTVKLPKDVWLSVLFKKLDTPALLLASRVCKHWRYAAAAHYKLAQNTLRGTGCFKPLIENFETSRHIFFMDVSSSMNIGDSKMNALQIFQQITAQIRSAIAANGMYVCKFANIPLIHFFKTQAMAEEFLHEESNLPDGTKLSEAVDAVYNNVLKSEKKKETHLYIISDMLLQHDNALTDKIFNAQKLSVLKRKVTFHYYPAKSTDNPALKQTDEQFELIKDKDIPGLKPGLKRKFSDTIDIKFYGLHVKKMAV